MLRLILCRHGVVHTERFQKLLLQNDVAKPKNTTNNNYNSQEQSLQPPNRISQPTASGPPPPVYITTHLFPSNLSMHSRGWMNCSTSSHWPSSTSCLSRHKSHTHTLTRGPSTLGYQHTLPRGPSTLCYQHTHTHTLTKSSNTLGYQRIYAGTRAHTNTTHTLLTVQQNKQRPQSEGLVRPPANC